MDIRETQKKRTEMARRIFKMIIDFEESGAIVEEIIIDRPTISFCPVGGKSQEARMLNNVRIVCSI